MAEMHSFSCKPTDLLQKQPAFIVKLGQIVGSSSVKYLWKSISDCVKLVHSNHRLKITGSVSIGELEEHVLARNEEQPEMSSWRLAHISKVFKATPPYWKFFAINCCIRRRIQTLVSTDFQAGLRSVLIVVNKEWASLWPLCLYLKFYLRMNLGIF